MMKPFAFGLKPRHCLLLAAILALCLAQIACKGGSGPAYCAGKTVAGPGSAELCSVAGNCGDANTAMLQYKTSVEGLIAQKRADLADLQTNNSDGGNTAAIQKINDEIAQLQVLHDTGLQHQLNQLVSECRDRVYMNYPGAADMTESNRDGGCRCSPFDAPSIANNSDSQNGSSFDQNNAIVDQLYNPNRSQTQSTELNAVAAPSRPNTADPALAVNSSGSASGGSSGRYNNRGFKGGSGTSQGGGAAGGGGSDGFGAGFGSNAANTSTSTAAGDTALSGSSGSDYHGGGGSGGQGGAHGGGSDSSGIAGLFDSALFGDKPTKTGPGGDIRFGDRNPAGNGRPGTDPRGAVNGSVSTMSMDEYLQLRPGIDLFRRATDAINREAVRWAVQPVASAGREPSGQPVSIRPNNAAN